MAHLKMPPVNMMRQLLMYKSGVPRRLRFWLFIFFATIYQFAGGVYLASVSQMVGAHSTLREDYVMAGYCTLIGLTIVFPMLFRIKFRFFTRQLFFITSIGLIICNLLTMTIETPWILWIICFVVGILKMSGMFGCMSSIQLCITPTRNFGVFFPVVYLLVCGAIQLSGICTAYICYFTDWRMMNLAVIAFLGIHAFLVYMLMKPDHRSGPYLPLKGIDWPGFILWSLLLIIGTWIFTFGEHFDWWNNYRINIASGLFLFILGLVIYRSAKCNEPYISLNAFAYPRVINLSFLLLGLMILQATAHSLQPVFVTAILHYDALNVISLNIPEFIGVVFGALLTYYTIVRWKWSVKQYLFFCFSLVTIYACSMYFSIDSTVNKEVFYLPLVALGIAEVMMEAMATYYLSQAIPFKHFFQTIAIIGFVRAGFGTSIGSAVVDRLFNWSLAKNFTISSEAIDCVLVSNGSFRFDQLMSNMSTQSIMLALKETYGYVIFVGIVMLMIVLLSNYKTTIRRMLPRLVSVRRWLVNPSAQDPTTI